MSVLIQVKTHQVADLPYLLRLVLRSIYEKDKMRADEMHLMQFSIIKWKRFLDDEIERYSERFKFDKLTPKLDHEFLQDYLRRLGWLLSEDQKGRFTKRKMLFKSHRIDWRKFHRLPEAYLPQDFAHGAETYREYAKKNPEQEDMGQQSTAEVKKLLNIVKNMQEAS